MNVTKGENTMSDNILNILESSIVQHGKENDRVYLMKMMRKDFPEIMTEINNLARANSYSKIFCKIPSWAVPSFISDGFVTEAIIPNFYNNHVDCYFVSKYLNSDRLLDIENDQLKALSEHLYSENRKLVQKTITDHPYSLRKLNEEDIENLASIYTSVFKTYPFPIHQPDFLLKAMQSNVQFYGLEVSGTLAAVSSAEIDFEGKNAEMTDFATLPEHRGKKFSILLLRRMEKEMLNQHIKTVYTIARLNSVAMTKTFLREKYNYAGTLIKNTNISGKIESMNVFYKHL
jgi:putative beta-lysine N-acetyltransferase